MDYDLVAHDLDRMGYPRRDTRSPLWELKPASWWRPKAVKQHGENQTKILEQILSTQREVYLIFSEDPVDNEIQGVWKEISEAHWRIPLGLEAEHLRESFLHYGNWCLYVAHEPVLTTFPDLFQGSVDEIILFIKRHNIRSAIESFHDDIEWAIVLHD